ncbi:hypothetical protein ILUMI_22617 [Ignelater luminosus]|uniref:BSD domain-containing protein n=1 Tax=Ignelater luminosus TaxID=2038154 RepID=A0A8K0CAB3_IGNLU|nr:hypothetical protein ILUMI_22617 [Ignelater luminosus]
MMGDSGDNNNYWLTSWLNAAKVKSSEVLEFVKKDLEEFGSTVKNEASSMVSTTGSVLEKTLKLNEPESAASSMKRSFSSFLGQMNNVLNPSPSPDDSDTEAILITEGSETVTLTKLQQAIYELQKNEKTFLEDPDPSLNKQYQCWLEIIDDQLTEERLNKHLNSSVTLNNQYLKLVPDNVPHQLFWKRYLFRKALLEDELARQEAMEKRELREKQITEEHLKWDQQDFATDIELSEEEQIRLLQQYEEETKQKTLQKQKPSKELIGENVIFKKSSPKKSSKKDSNVSQTNSEVVEASSKVIENEKLVKGECNIASDKNNDSIATERNEDHFKERLLSNKVSDLKINKTSSSNSLDLETKSSNSSSDGDWEKISDVDK